MSTAHSAGAPSAPRRAARGQRTRLAVAAALCLITGPCPQVVSFASQPSPSPSCPATPSGCPSPLPLTLTQTADRITASIGQSVTYTITLTGTGPRAVAAVTVDDVLGGDAGYLVDDGTGGTANSFAGSPMAIVTRVATGHYRWSYIAVNPGDRDVLRFSLIITVPGGRTPGGGSPLNLTSTASTPGTAAAAAVTTSVVSAAGGPGPNGSAVPGTGSTPSLRAAVLLFVGGLGLVLLAARSRKRAGGTANGAAPPPALSR